MLSIVNAPNAVLSDIAKPVSKVSTSVISFISEMKKTLVKTTDPKGVGLAAPQVDRSLRIFIAKPTDNSPILTFINPVIKKFLDTSSQKKQEANQSEKTIAAKEKAGIDKNVRLEGCLSLKDIWGEVKRTPAIELQYQLITNNHELITKTQTFSGFMATIIQHETDHLNGILFPRRVLEQKGQLYKSRKDEKGEDIFEEIEI